MNNTALQSNKLSFAIVINKLKIISMAYPNKFISCLHQAYKAHLIPPRQPGFLCLLRLGTTRMESLVAVIKCFHQKETRALLFAWSGLPPSRSATTRTVSLRGKREIENKIVFHTMTLLPDTPHPVQFC